MLYNVSKGVVYSDTALQGQDGDREGMWVGAGGALAPNTSPYFPLSLQGPRATSFLSTVLS